MIQLIDETFKSLSKSNKDIARNLIAKKYNNTIGTITIHWLGQLKLPENTYDDVYEIIAKILDEQIEECKKLTALRKSKKINKLQKTK